jgi:hypothetical protein
MTFTNFLVYENLAYTNRYETFQIRNFKSYFLGENNDYYTCIYYIHTLYNNSTNKVLVVFRFRCVNVQQPGVVYVPELGFKLRQYWGHEIHQNIVQRFVKERNISVR